MARVCLASPKSRILTRPSRVRRILSGLRSRWTMPALWAAASPAARHVERLAETALVGDRRAFHQFHHQVVGSDIIELADVGMVQGRDGAGFVFEALGEALLGDFDGDSAVEARVASLPHLAHPALAEGREKLVGAEFVAGGDGHCSGLRSS